MGGIAALSLLGGFACPVQAAERLSLRYGFLARSLSIADLETYARTGERSPQLASYARWLRPEQEQKLRDLLRQRIELEPISVAQFLYSPMGEQLLHRLAQVLKTESSSIGFYGLRGAFILAAADPEGLTLLNVLRHFPTPSIQIDLTASLQTFAAIQALVAQTDLALAAVQTQSQTEARDSSSPASPGLSTRQQPGPWQWQKVNLSLKDATPERLGLTGSARSFSAEIYLPQSLSPRPRPVVVISHGLGSNLQSYGYLAEHLASFGFVVAVPEHPGSSTNQLMIWLRGGGKQVVQPVEFIDRPLDVKFLLDELERRSTDPVFRERLDLNQVGILGQSFGAYTALSLVGASLNLQHLRQSCGNQLENAFNLSLLLQCQALALPQPSYEFKDPRVKAVIAINPITSGVFGAASLAAIQQPVMLIASSADTVAPPLPEQIQPFTWLTSPERYLVLMDKATHSSTLGESPSESEAFPIPANLIGPQPTLARSYLEGLSTAFFQTYLEPPRPRQSLLTAATVREISRPPIQISLVRRLSAASLKGLLETSRLGMDTSVLDTQILLTSDTPNTPKTANR
jgi:predicted dienelactone hydrolase